MPQPSFFLSFSSRTKVFVVPFSFSCLFSVNLLSTHPKRRMKIKILICEHPLSVSYIFFSIIGDLILTFMLTSLLLWENVLWWASEWSPFCTCSPSYKNKNRAVRTKSISNVKNEQKCVFWSVWNPWTMIIYYS